MKLPLLTSSRLRDARACQRLHKYRYLGLYRPVVEFAELRFGTLMHRALEAWWKAWGLAPNERLALALKALEGAEPFDLARATALMIGYHHRWIAEPYEVLAVEVTFEGPLRNPETGQPSRTWRLGGKLDVLVRDLRDRRVFVVEHKTSSEDISQGSEYWRRLRMDGQVSVYYEGATFLGHHVDGCLYDVIAKPALRPLQATPEESRKYTKAGVLYAKQRLEDETPADFHARLVEDIAADPARYYQRGEVVRLEAEMDEALHDVWQIGRQIREAQLANRYPRNPDACVKWGKTCPFFAVCTGEASLEDSTQFERIAEPHPELQPEAPVKEAVQ